MRLSRKCNKEALADLIGRMGLSLRHNKRSYILKCPICSKVKLYIEKESGRGICFHCGDDFRGWADQLLAQVLGQPRQSLAEELYGERFVSDMSQFEVRMEDWWGEFGYDDDTIAIAEELPDLIWSPDIRPLALGSAGERYLDGRGIPYSVAKEYGIRYNGRERRVVFPVVVDGSLKGWQGRYIDRCEFYNPETSRTYTIPKVLTTGQVGGKAFMFQDSLKGSPHAILCEGPVDAIKCHLAGGAVASMGKGVTKTHLDIIVKSGVRKLYVALDPDAYEDIMRVAREMVPYSHIELYRMEPPRGSGAKDIGDLTVGAAYEAFKTAPRLYAGQLFAYFSKPV